MTARLPRTPPAAPPTADPTGIATVAALVTSAVTRPSSSPSTADWNVVQKRTLNAPTGTKVRKNRPTVSGNHERVRATVSNAPDATLLTTTNRPSGRSSRDDASSVPASDPPAYAAIRSPKASGPPTDAAKAGSTPCIAPAVKFVTTTPASRTTIS